MCSAGLLLDRASEERSPMGKKIKEKKETTHLRAPGAVEPKSGLIVVEPLAPCPWYLQSVLEYAKGLS